MLVATDVAARGIDVDDISHVINYNLPDELEVYTHRSGRTGRMDKSGVSISIVNYKEKSKIPQIEKIIHKKCEKLQVPGGEEICKKQLFHFINRMEHAEVDEDQIAPFMKTVNKKLEWMSKEQIIKHFVSLEFNRLLEYYKGAGDLNEKAESKGKAVNKEDTGKRNGKDQGKGKNGYTRFFINVGKKQGLAPKNIIGMINDQTKDRKIKIGDIEMKDNFSFFEVGTKHTDKVLTSMHNNNYRGKRLKVEVAGDKKGERKKEKAGKK
jgi:ATP-dependent RNA helicase DeaD